MFVPSACPEAQAICERAAQELILRFAFAGLVLCGERIRIEVRPGVVDTLATDGRTIFVSPDYITAVNENEGMRGVIFRLLHEYFHCFFNHPERRLNRDPRRWNIAADIMVNRLCCEALTTPKDTWCTPKDGIQPTGWEAYTTAEAIYDELTKMSEDGLETFLPPGGNYEDDVLPSPFRTEAEKDEFHASLAEEIVQAEAIITLNIGTTELPPAVRNRLNHIKQGVVPWARLLAGRLLTDIGDRAATFSPPRRRTYPWLIQPSYKGLKEKKLALLIDNSGSVGEELHKEFRSAIKPACRRADEIHIIGFDSHVREHVVVTRAQEVDTKLKYKVGAHGYTSVVDAFALIDKVRPSAIACLTDGYIKLPPVKPYYRKTIWCVPVTGQKQPWGTNFVMDTAW